MYFIYFVCKLYSIFSKLIFSIESFSHFSCRSLQYLNRRYARLIVDAVPWRIIDDIHIFGILMWIVSHRQSYYISLLFNNVCHILILYRYTWWLRRHLCPCVTFLYLYIIDSVFNMSMRPSRINPNNKLKDVNFVLRKKKYLYIQKVSDKMTSELLPLYSRCFLLSLILNNSEKSILRIL